jgi:L-iditol 2-dehydrogenase
MAPAAAGEPGEVVLQVSHTSQVPTEKSAVTSNTCQASVLHGPLDLRLVRNPYTVLDGIVRRLTESKETRIIEEPSLGELQIQIRSTGICGSDVSYYKKFANGDLCACAPLSLGHESSGVVVAIGPQVNGFSIGDRVALEVGIPCGQCGICRKGRYNLCKKMCWKPDGKTE